MGSGPFCLAGEFTELATWTATANDALLKQLDQLGFRPIDQESAAFGCPCFLVRATNDERLDEDWRLGDTRLLDLKNWDIRMLFSMARVISSGQRFATANPSFGGSEIRERRASQCKEQVPE